MGTGEHPGVPSADRLLSLSLPRALPFGLLVEPASALHAPVFCLSLILGRWRVLGECPCTCGEAAFQPSSSRGVLGLGGCCWLLRGS